MKASEAEQLFARRMIMYPIMLSLPVLLHCMAFQTIRTRYRFVGAPFQTMMDPLLISLVLAYPLGLRWGLDRRGERQVPLSQCNSCEHMF